jgi:hypothetical protein
MIENETELKASLDYARRCARVLEGVAIWGQSAEEEPDPALMSGAMMGPLSAVCQVLEEALEFLEAGRAEVTLDKAA